MCVFQGRLQELIQLVRHIWKKTVKAVYQGFQSTVLVVPKNGEYVLLPKDMVKCF